MIDALATTRDTMSAPKNIIPRVALITVGQPRTVAHPAVAQSFELLRSSLVDYGVHHFLWLTQTPPPARVRRHRHAASPGERQALAWARPLDLNSPAWRKALVLYAPTIFVLSNASLPCRPHCGLRCDTMKHDAPIEWLRQFFAISNAWRTVLRFEQEQMAGEAHRWYCRLRPDLLHLQPLLPLSSLDTAAVHVPSGIMTSHRRYQKLNDHMALCAKRDVCANFFTIADEYAKCGRDFRMPWPPQLLYARKYMHMHDPVHGLSGSRTRSDDSRAALRLFEHAYTVTRPGSGPECNRLGCIPRDPFATGCVARHLPAALQRCERLARAWSHNVSTGSTV